MFFDQTVEYALRVMACLALQHDGGKLTSKELSDQSNVPQAYLSKVLRQMVTAKLLNAEKGHRGGFSLARPLSRVSLYDVFEVFLEARLPRTCVFGLDVCSDANPCVLHHRWKQLRLSFESWAKSTTLADIRDDVLSAKAPAPHLRHWKLIAEEHSGASAKRKK